MRFVRELKDRITNSKLIKKIRSAKNAEIVVALIFALIAGVTYFVISAKTSSNKPTASMAQNGKMTEEEERLAELISDISGVGKTRVLITTDNGNEVIGVVVVAEGAKDMNNRVKMIRCVEKATGATVDKIEIFEMANGG
ncbi:MAG TPA: hypothetical protein DHV31_01740 [Clostridiales bacterium]|nr:hypothetical protein [Clostridiales bacterium]